MAALVAAPATASETSAPAFRSHVYDGGAQGNDSTGGIYSLGVGGMGSDGGSRQVGVESAPTLCSSGEKKSVLFVGNSYTHYFEMPLLLEGMAKSAGCDLDVEYVAPGGTRLKDHANSGETLSAIGSRSWDVVVLQNYSQLPSQPLSTVRSRTLPHVAQLVDAIRHNDPSTDILFYVTWGRRDGDKKYCDSNPQVCSFRGHTAALQRGYSFYSETFSAGLANVGAAFAQASADRRAPFAHRELYDRDGSHPSLKGSYLAASVFFATLYGVSPEGLSYPEGLSKTSARYLQRVAGSLPLSGV